MNSYPIPKVVAEIGCNHKGDLDIARELIDLAHQCGADYAKFQKRDPQALSNTPAYQSPHPVPYNAYGNTYAEHRAFLEFDFKEHEILKAHCDQVGIGYSCSAWDMASAKVLCDLEVDYIKIPSACNNHLEMITFLRDNYKGQIHISVGMTTVEEEQAFMDLFSDLSPNRLVLYSCTSGYPVAFDQVCLLEIKRLAESYGQQLAAIGFSGHHLGIAIDIAAYTLGVKWIERHFTKDRTWKGTDHAASLEPAGLSKLVRNLQATHQSLTYKSSSILDIEKPQRDKLKFKS